MAASPVVNAIASDFNLAQNALKKMAFARNTRITKNPEHLQYGTVLVNVNLLRVVK